MTASPVRVGINGFGRIGRLALRAAWDRPELTFVHVNEPAADAHACAHLLAFDSVHGRWGREATGGEDRLMLDGTPVAHSSRDTPGAVPWAEAGVDVVLECSGRFRTMEALAPYAEAGMRKVLVAAPVKDPRALNVVMGVNTAASCTTNSAAGPCAARRRSSACW